MPTYDPFANSNPAEPSHARRNIVPVQYGILSCLGPESGPTTNSKPLLESMWRHKWLVFAVGILGLIGGYVVTRFQTPIYRASSTLEVLNLNENILSRDLSQTVAPGQDADVLTEAKLLQSWHLVDRVKRRLTANPGPAAASGAAGQNTSTASPLRAADVDWAAQTLTISVPERTRVLEITCDSPDARTAAAFANTLATEFAEASVGSRHYSSMHTSKWLSEQIDELKRKLLRSQQELQTYVGQNELVFTSEHGTMAEERLRQIQLDLSRTQAELVVRQARHELASKSPPETLPEILDSASLRESQNRINELKRQLAELLSSFTPAYYKVERVQAQLATLEPLLQKETENVMGRIRNEYADAKRREDLLIEAYQRQAQLVSVQAGRAVHYDILKREVDSERQLYESMLTRVKEVGMAAAMGTGNIRIVDTANVPLVPRRPRPALNGGVGSLCGLAAGGLLALLKMRADRSIREPGEAGECLNLPEFGAIPSIRRISKLPRRKEAEPTSLVPLLGEAPETAPDWSSGIWDEPFSMAAESFRTLALSILFAKYYSRVLAVVSAMPKDGKTTVGVHLAIGLALKGERVLLVDGDLRKPRLHRIFGNCREKGLADLLAQDSPAEPEQLKAYLSKTTTPGLHVLSHGSVRVGTDALHKGRMLGLMTSFRAEFDRVIVDTPPMLHLADARILGRLADGVILVVRAGVTDRDAAVFAVNHFARDGTNVLGCVLNDWNPRKSAYRYYNPKLLQRYYSRDSRG